MKTIPFLALFAVLILSSSYVSAVINKPAPEAVEVSSSSFNQFRIHRQADAAILTWSVANADVAQFIVERSYDGEFFEALSEMNCTGTGVHKFKDDTVFPGVIYYRVKALKVDATEEYSPVETLRIVQRK
jgi:hypothetical protein